MDIAGAYRIPVAREAVWAALNDPDVLARCIPGCKELVQVSPEEMTARVALKIGPVSATTTTETIARTRQRLGMPK